jgi:ComEC/Rec2-related protein
LERGQKWETYKNIYNALSLPTFHFFLICVSIISIYNFTITQAESELINFTVSTVMFTFSLVVNCFKNRYFYRKKFFHIVIISAALSVSLFLSLITQHRVSESLADGTVINVQEYRYSKRVDFKHKNSKCCSYLPYDIQIRKGDLFIADSVKSIEADSLFSQTLLKEGIRYTAYFNKQTEIKQLSGPSIKEKLRSKLFQRIDTLFDLKTAALLKALLIGSKHYLDKETIYHYKKSGLLHLLAASGMHVGIVAGILFLILGRFPINQKTNLLICSVVLVIYLFMTNIPVSLLRACIMFWVFTLFTINDNFKNAFNILFLSGIIILLLKPDELYSLGFQLSFLATFGILLTYKTFTHILPKIPLKISESIALSLSAQMFVIPVIFFTLGEFTTAGIAATIPSVPLLTGILYSAFASLFLSLVHPALGTWSAHIANFLNYVLDLITDQFSQFNLHVSNAGLEVVLIPLVIFLFSAFINKLNKIKAPILLGTLILLSSLILLSHPERNFKVIQSKKNKYTYLLHENDTIIAAGTIDKDDAPYIISYISNSGADKIILVPTYNKTAYSFKPLVTNLPVSAVYFLSNYNRNEKNKLIKLLERDKIYYKTASRDSIKQINEELGYELIKQYKNKIIFDKMSLRGNLNRNYIP